MLGGGIGKNVEEVKVSWICFYHFKPGIIFTLGLI